MASTEDTLRFGGRFAEWTPLARGAEGRLFRVRDRWTGHVAALKLAEASAGRESLAAEYRLLGRLAHPCLIESRDLVRDGPDLAHLLEFVPATPAERLWEEGGETAVRAALIQSLRGLEYLHRRGYLHGDVAPGNLLVWREGEHWRAKVADLGLALPLSAAQSGGVRGTPGYMAPETARGESAGAAADLFALALTAVTWIDGRHPLEGASPAEMLRRLAGRDCEPSPRRAVSRDLLDLIASLGRGDPAARSFGDWSDLRAQTEAWGPAVQRGGVYGVEDRLAEWRDWLNNLARGRAAGIVVRGRVGSGRRTLCRAMARLLVAEGWTGLAEQPLALVRDRLETSTGDHDPVTLARELVERFTGRDAVVLWPERPGDLESRLLRAFVVSREEEGAGSRTCILKAAPLAGEDPDGDWIEASARCLAVNWAGPNFEALESLRDDLFPEEEGYGAGRERPGVEEGASPLSLVRLKQVGAGSGVGLTDEAMSAEVVKAWEGCSPGVRDVLALLAWSERGWRWRSLARALGWKGGSSRRIQQDLERLGLTRRDYERGELQERLTDRLVRGALAPLVGNHIEEDRLAVLARELESDGEMHPGDLLLARTLTERGRYPAGYVRMALDQALRDGRFEAVIEFWEAVRSEGHLDAAHHPAVWEAALRAVQRLGRFPQELRVLEDLLRAAPNGAEAVEWRKMLAAARFALGDWQGAVGDCDVLASSAAVSAEDSAWARIQKAEFLWQTGRFAEADAVYGELDPERLPSPELLLRYFVGRARQSAQRMDYPVMRERLAEAEAALGQEDCYADPLFLHAMAGLMLETGEQVTGVPLAARAEQLAEAAHLWKHYPMIASRASALALECGEVRSAQRLSTKGIATATALNSERMVALSMSFLAICEIQLGLVGSALKRREVLLRTGTKLDDGLLLAAYHRLGLYIASLVGLKSLADLSADAMSRIPSVNFAPLIAEYTGLLELGAGNWEAARELLTRAAEGHRELTQEDGEAGCWAYCSLAEMRLGLSDEARRHLQAAKEVFERGKYPFFMPRYLLIRCEVESPADTFAADAAFAELQREGRGAELVMWAPLITKHCASDSQIEVRRAILEAIRKAADSFESSALRKEFLAHPRTRIALLAVQGV